jgi:hypothetical protein
MGRIVFSEIRRLCIAAQRDGIFNIPEHFHNAIMYKGFYFVDPYNQAEFNKMALDLSGEIRVKGLARVTWAVGTGALRLDEQPWEWKAGEQICPFSRRCFSYFHSCHYTDIVAEHEIQIGRFTIDWNAVGSKLGGGHR